MVDCSHANSSKDHRKQSAVLQDVAQQIEAGEQRIKGLMIESHLVAGRQDVKPGEALCYGQSITDACIAWEETATLLPQLAKAVHLRRLRLAR
jgi:3-deoxy-7-phosphoheptulonate synthase